MPEPLCKTHSSIWPPHSSSDPGLCSSLCWISWDSCLFYSPACQGPSNWQHKHLMYQLILSVSYHLETCWVTRSLVKKLTVVEPVATTAVYHWWLTCSWICTTSHKSLCNFNQFSVQLIIHLSSLYFICLSTRILWGRVWNALLKPRKTRSIAFN